MRLQVSLSLKLFIQANESAESAGINDRSMASPVLFLVMGPWNAEVRVAHAQCSCLTKETIRHLPILGFNFAGSLPIRVVEAQAQKSTIDGDLLPKSPAELEKHFLGLIGHVLVRHICWLRVGL